MIKLHHSERYHSLSPNYRFTPYTKETLRLLTARGVHCVFATGRHHVDVSQMRDSLEIEAYMITSIGARVHNTAGELIFSHNLDEDIAHDLYALKYDDADILTHVYRDDEWFLNRHRPEEERYFRESVFTYQVYEPGLLPTDGISKVFFTCDESEKLVPLEEAILARWGDRVNVCFSLPTCLEVMAGGVSKGHALEEVSKLLGYAGRERLHYARCASAPERSAAGTGRDWFKRGRCGLPQATRAVPCLSANAGGSSAARFSSPARLFRPALWFN